MNKTIQNEYKLNQLLSTDNLRKNKCHQQEEINKQNSYQKYRRLAETMHVVETAGNE